MSSAPRKVSNYLPFNQEDLRNSGFDYIALGHYHQHKLFDDDYGNIIAAYPGSPEPLGFDETGPHGIISGTYRKVPMISTFNQYPTGSISHWS